ncbi:MAG TPA: tetratricopeptide repeat protein, partial [Chthoniobacteraceae bacterium]
NIAGYRDQALISESQADKEMGKLDDEIRVLEKLISPEIRNGTQARGAVRLVECYAGKSNSDKAVALLATLQKKTGLIENLISLNALAVKLGDELGEKKLYGQAIQAYRAVRSRDEVLTFQTARIAAMEARIEANLKAATGNPQAFVAATQANNEIKEQLTEAKQLLTEFEKLPDFTPTLLFRIAKCWYDWDRKWEAIVVYDRILTKYPAAKAQREPALYGMLIAYAEAGRVPRCQELCAQYLQEFPDGANAATVGYLSGAVALQAGDPKGAESYFGVMLQKQPNSNFRERMRYLLGVAKFMQGKYDDAAAEFGRYEKDFSSGESLEEVRYRHALCFVFAGEYEKAMDALNGYEKKYPKGDYLPDCKYRLMVCLYAAQQYDQVIDEAKAWREKYRDDAMQGEVCAILGDAFAAENKEEECIPAYVDSYKKATTDEVLNYSLFEASKHLQKLGRWADVSKMFQEFVKDQPDHPAVVAAMYWIGRALGHDGKSEEAKAYLVENLQKYIADPKRDAVEQLLQQLAQLCTKHPRPALPAAAAASASTGAAGAPDAALAKTAAAAGAAATPAPEAATPPPYDPFAELDKQLASFGKLDNDTVKARVLYAKSELDRLRKKTADADKIYDEIANRFQPESLSPLLLAQVGDFLYAKGKKDRAIVLYTRLKEEFPKSDYVDYAYVGLGESAFDGKKYKDALNLFSDAIDKYSGTKLKEATVGRAKTLLELGRYEDARKHFEEIAGMREWRGDATAFAVYSLGEVEARQGHWAEAIARYQRVFVAYQKFLPWVAKAYVRSAESFEKLGRRSDAVNSLKEMLHNEKLEALPEAARARKLLEQWGASA